LLGKHVSAANGEDERRRVVADGVVESLGIATATLFVPAFSPRGQAGGLRHGHVPE